MGRLGPDSLASLLHPVLRRLEDDLDALTLVGAWRVVLLSVVCIAAANYYLFPLGLQVQPLYILPLCLAGWRLGLAASLGVAVLVALLATGIRVYLYQELSGWLAVGNLTILTLMLCLVAGVVSSFRFRYDLERDHASKDRLTGAYNRQAFTRRFDSMITSLEGETSSLLLAFIDLDGFKAVNDTGGHREGDNVLKLFVIGATLELRGVDCLGRLGGDEFAVLAPAETEAEARRLAGHLHRRFSDILANTGHRVTCSMGAVIVPSSVSRSSNDLIEDADQLMYAAKRGGKNSWRLAPLQQLSQQSDQPRLDV